MSSPYLYPLSSPTATCSARIYSSPGDAESCCISSCCWKRTAHLACDMGRMQPRCCAVGSQKASVICLLCSGTLHSAAPASGWQSHKGQLRHPHRHHTKFHQNAGMHTLLWDPQKQLALTRMWDSSNRAPCHLSLTMYTWLHVWQQQTSHKLNMPPELPLHTDCSSGPELGTRINWIWMLWEVIYFKYKTLWNLTAVPQYCC